MAKKTAAAPRSAEIPCDQLGPAMVKKLVAKKLLNPKDERFQGDSIKVTVKKGK